MCLFIPVVKLLYNEIGICTRLRCIIIRHNLGVTLEVQRRREKINKQFPQGNKCERGREYSALWELRGGAPNLNWRMTAGRLPGGSLSGGNGTDE